MVFSSSIFLFIFLPIVLLVYYVVPQKARNWVLLVASLFFYWWGEDRLVILLVLSSAINYCFGVWIFYLRERESICKVILAIGICLNLLLLGYYKYFDFAVDTVNRFLNTDFQLPGIVLPIGISFFTFQGMSYIIDLYRKQTDVQKNPFKIMLYISLFPQLVAGPIIRYSDVSLMIDKRETNSSIFAEGVRRFSIGLAKKVLIANSLAPIADAVFNLPLYMHQPSTLWLGIICFTLQLYFDFSGYSDMVIGIGLMFGFRFKENFNFPYIAKSIREFWRRWHISLSSFFRDYLYIPLGGNIKGNMYFNLLIVFLATGLWHGASFSFIVWGLWHGFFIVLENVIKRNCPKVLQLIRGHYPVISAIRHIYTLFVVIIGWVFFRCSSITDGAHYVKSMLLWEYGTDVKLSTMYYLDGYHLTVLICAIVFSVPVISYLKQIYNERFTGIIARNVMSIAQTVLPIVLLVLSALTVMNQGYNPFLYFRF